MSPISTTIFLVSIVALSSASTSPSPAISRLPNSNSNSNSNSSSNSNLSQVIQKSTSFCTSNSDCWNSKLGTYSTCVNHYCTCDFSYKKEYPSEKCTKIDCSYDSDCSYPFSHSRCDITDSCVCDVNYMENKTTAECEKKKDCTHDYDCSGVFTRCDAWNSCVCDFGYRKDSYGICISTSYIPSPNTLPVILPTVGIGFLISIVGTVGVLMYRRKQRGQAGRVLQSPVATVHQAGGMAGPGMGHPHPQPYPGQPGFNVPVGYQAGPAMYAAPYGNVQSPPPYGVPSYSQAQPTVQTHPQQQQTSSGYPNGPKM